MAAEHPQKICVLCGEDCSNRPRIKDPRGRYYCRSCHEEARRALEARKALDETPLDLTPPELTLPAEPELASPEASPTPPIGCPGCGRRMEPGAVICTSCGFNIKTGQSVQPVIEAAVPTAGPAAAKRPRWPLVIGVISILFGIGGALLHGLNLVMLVVMSLAQWATSSLVAIAASMIVLFLSVWLLAAGIGVLLRKPRAAESIRRWAVVKIILYTICMGVGIVALLAVRDTVDQVALRAGRQPGELEVASVVVSMVLGLAWFLSWPIFVLIWFARDAVRADVRHW